MISMKEHRCMDKGLLGSIVWNALSVHYDDDNVQSAKTNCKMAKKVDTLHRMDFNAFSVQSILNFKEDFIFY